MKNRHLLPVALTLALLVIAGLPVTDLRGDPPAQPKSGSTYPAWDGSETIEHYAQRAGLKPTQSFDLGNGVKLDLVLIPAGKFIMGSPLSEKDRTDDENQHEVTLTKPFYLGKDIVTDAQWEQVMNKNPKSPPDLNDPKAFIWWDGASWYVSELNKKLGKKSFRLPTEAEWEWACRAGTKTRFYSGDSEQDLAEAGWYESNSGGGKELHAVGLKKPNAWGLYDMHGLLWQWCQDWLDPKGYPPGPAVDPTGPARREDSRFGKMKACRGGSFHESAPNCRSARRGWLDENSHNFNRGMRVAMSVDGAQ